MTTTKQEKEEEEMQEAESVEKHEPHREELKPLEAMFEPPKETKLPIEPLTFSATSDLLTSSQFKPGQHVLICGLS